MYSFIMQCEAFMNSYVNLETTKMITDCSGFYSPVWLSYIRMTLEKCRCRQFYGINAHNCIQG